MGTRGVWCRPQPWEEEKLGQFSFQGLPPSLSLAWTFCKCPLIKADMSRSMAPCQSLPGRNKQLAVQASSQVAWELGCIVLHGLCKHSLLPAAPLSLVGQGGTD